MKCKYNYQNKVEFKYNNINKVGYIEIKQSIFLQQP